MSFPRRTFLKQSLSATTLLSFNSMFPAFLDRAAYSSEQQSKASKTVLVVVELAGGNDGLNTVIPYADDEYAKNRSTLRFTANEVHKIDSYLGFHPRMEGFKRLFDDGYLSVVQGVGYPNPNQDHAVGMRNWQTALPDQPNCQTGWLGRTADYDLRDGKTIPPAIHVSDGPQPFALNAETGIIPSVRSLDDLQIKEWPDAKGTQIQHFSLDDTPKVQTHNPLRDFIERCASNAQQDSQRMDEIARSTKSNVEYPSFRLARQLQTIAGLIRADLGIRIFYTDLSGGSIGGFDNHANQRGNHCALLHQLSESVTAFVHDLKKDNLIDQVLLMTFSEFGRTLKENGRRGTGHGSAAPMFLAGGSLKGGLIGNHPSLTNLDDSGSPKHHTDFRQVYSTILEDWLQYDSEAILGKKYSKIFI